MISFFSEKKLHFVIYYLVFASNKDEKQKYGE
jgi:hypothetical protein